MTVGGTNNRDFPYFHKKSPRKRFLLLESYQNFLSLRLNIVSCLKNVSLNPGLKLENIKNLWKMIIESEKIMKTLEKQPTFYHIKWCEETPPAAKHQINLYNWKTFHVYEKKLRQSRKVTKILEAPLQYWQMGLWFCYILRSQNTFSRFTHLSIIKKSYDTIQYWKYFRTRPIMVFGEEGK